jgi:outer membrane protein
MRSVNRIVLVSVVLLSTVAQAQEKLTFKEAVKIGLDNNVRLHQQMNQQYVNQAQKISAFAGVGPRVDASFQAMKIMGNQFIEQEARVVNDARTNNFFGSINASIVIFNGFNRINSISEADARLDAQQYLIKRTEQDVISLVSNQFLQCLLDQETLKIEEENLVLQKNQLSQIQEQVNLGSRAEVDRYNQDYQVKDAELRVLRAQNTLRNDKATLANTLLVNPSLDFEIEDPKWDLTELSELENQSLEELYVIALSNRADLLQAKELELATRKNMNVALSNNLPTLSAFAGLNSRYSNASVPSFDTQLNENRRMLYGLQLDIPIFTGWRNRTTHVQSRVNYQNAMLTASGTEVTVKSDVLRAYQNYKDAILSYQASSSQLEAARLNFGLQKERYELAATDLIQFVQANRDFVQAQTNFARTKYTLLFQNTLLNYSLGTLKFEDIP